MKDKRPDRKHGGWAGVVVVSVLMPILYVASIGPATWLVNHTSADSEIIGVFYVPLVFIHDNCEPIRAVLDWYVEFWE